MSWTSRIIAPAAGGTYMWASLLRMVAAIALLMVSATAAVAQKVEFSADMRVLDGTGHTEMFKLYIGNQRVRLDRADSAGEQNGISSLIIEFPNQLLYLLIPQTKMYFRVAGASGMPFYEAAWMFRPQSPAYPCNQWVQEADKRGITLRCKRAGEEHVGGRPTQKWEATSPEGASGFL